MREGPGERATEINFMCGGEAGQGVQTVGFVLAKALARGGLHVFADQDYESRIRGGHNFFRVRADAEPVQAVSQQLNVLIALNKETIDLHRVELRDDGLAIFDREKTKVEDEGTGFLNVPLEKLAVETAGDRLMSNSVAAGAALGATGFDMELLAEVLRQSFTKAGGDVGERNVKAARAGYEYAVQHARQGGARISPVPAGDRPKRMLLMGNEALALGALAAGCKFLAGYPMTPTTSIIEFMADKGREHNVVVVQPEDEIAAMNMVVGAAYAGVRAMTATSGGGFSLMVEALSLAGITETPVVVVLGQRAGPAIGLPTRTEQGELWFALHAGHGEFPRAVLSPATVEGCFHAAVKAFNLAEKYQAPAIILTDQYLASSYNTVDRFDLGQVSIERGELLDEAQSNAQTDYKRYSFSESGVSPRALPGIGKALVVADSDEHDEAGHITEDAETRRRMVQKRMRKLEGLRSEISGPLAQREPGSELTLVGWGSTYGAIREAAFMLKGQGLAVDTVHLTEVWPFPAAAVQAALEGARRTLVVENNATGQLARLIRAETGIKVTGGVLKYDGRPFSPEEIVAEVRKEAAVAWR